MRAMVVVGHPDPESFGGAIGRAIRDTWADAGIEVAFHDLTAEAFPPLLTPAESRGEPTTDPIVRAHIAELLASDLLAVVHPNCWGAPPAIMKGWIDRVFAPNAAYSFAKGEDVGSPPEGLLGTRAALVINTGNTELAREHAVFGDPLERIWRDCILGFCGVEQLTRRLFGVVATSSQAQRAEWLDEARRLAIELAG